MSNYQPRRGSYNNLSKNEIILIFEFKEWFYGELLTRTAYNVNYIFRISGNFPHRSLIDSGEVFALNEVHRTWKGERKQISI